MRYFLISYRYLINASLSGFGELHIESDIFPSRATIKRKVSEIHYQNVPVVDVLNIFEFKSKEDFDNFTK